MLEIKIKTIPIAYEFKKEDLSSLSPPELGAIQQAHMNAVKKAWTPLITNLLGIGEEVNIELIKIWAESYVLGERSKKQIALAEKKAKIYIEEKFDEARYAKKDVKERGLIEKSLEEMWARDDMGRFMDEAKKELQPFAFLDPKPIEYSEYLQMREES